MPAKLTILWLATEKINECLVKKCQNEYCWHNQWYLVGRRYVALLPRKRKRKLYRGSWESEFLNRRVNRVEATSWARRFNGEDWRRCFRKCLSLVGWFKWNNRTHLILRQTTLWLKSPLHHFTKETICHRLDQNSVSGVGKDADFETRSFMFVFVTVEHHHRKPSEWRFQALYLRGFWLLLPTWSLLLHYFGQGYVYYAYWVNCVIN